MTPRSLAGLVLPVLLILPISGCSTWNEWIRADSQSSRPTSNSTTADSQPRAVFFNPPESEQISRTLGYSQAMRAGDWVRVSAQVGFDHASGQFPTAFDDQVDLAFEHLRLALASAGATLSQVVELNTYQTDMSRYQQVIKVRQDVFGRHQPLWTAVGVDELSDPAAQFAVSAVAYSPRR